MGLEGMVLGYNEDIDIPTFWRLLYYHKLPEGGGPHPHPVGVLPRDPQVWDFGDCRA